MSGLLVLSADEIRARCPIGDLIGRLREAFCEPIAVPGRRVTAISGGNGGRLMLYMPAFDTEGGGAVKLATVFPDNAARGMPTIQAAIVVFSRTGAPVALLDGAMVTRLRTGAASALASTYLSRADSSHLLVVGTGALAPFMALAHSTVRPIRHISVFGRRVERAQATVEEIRLLIDKDIDVQVATVIEKAAADADVISCATSSATPVLRGAWLRPGVFVDLVGSFSATHREADDETVQRSRIFVDTLDGALSEAGDLIDPLERGAIGRERIEGELGDLVSGRLVGRREVTEITLFKSVGTAIEDLAAAQMIVAEATSDNPLIPGPLS